MKAYLSVGKLKFVNGLQYRSAALAGLATQFFWGFIIIMVYVAFYSQLAASVAAPMPLSALVAYVWLQQALLALIVLWFRDMELFSLITSGNIAYELCRPCGIYEFWYAKLLSSRLASAALRSVPILAVGFFLPEPYRMSPPHSAVAGLLFFAALALGLLVLVAISMFIYLSVFWTMSPIGSTLMISVAGEFLAGLIIPVPLMPNWLQNVAYALPFRWTADFPFRVYSGQIAVQEASLGLGIQAIWLILLVAIGKYVMRRAMRRVVIQGG